MAKSGHFWLKKRSFWGGSGPVLEIKDRGKHGRRIKEILGGPKIFTGGHLHGWKEVEISLVPVNTPPYQT